ncbi:MAG: hypothetical protein ACRDYZ_02450 [Acidimicrobiales bacterium]
MSSLVVDTNVLARAALGDLQSADEIASAIERLRGGADPVTALAERPSLAMRMVAP